MAITTGAPNTAVTELMESSVGENNVLASRSLNRQNTAPPRKHPGITTMGFAVLNSCLIIWGTAIHEVDGSRKGCHCSGKNAG